MPPPPLSVLLPVRDAQAYLPEALGSLRAQTFADYELVAVDDASTDSTRTLLDEAARADPRIRVVPGAGRGLVAALEVGLAHCRAPLIARMDGDDVAQPTRFARQVEAFADDPGLVAAGSRVELFPREGMSPGLLAYEEWLNSLVTPEAVARDRFVESPLVHPAAMLRAAPLRAAGGWRDQGWPEDYALWLELASRGCKLTNLPEVLLRWRDRPDRLTRRHPDYSPAAHLRLKAHYLARGPLAAGRCVVWGAGKTGRALRRALLSEGVVVERFVDIDPAKVGRPLHGVPVIAPQDLGGPRGVPLIAAVGAKGARAVIRSQLGAKGWREEEHFTCVG